MTRRAFLSSKSNTAAWEMTRRAFLSSKSNTVAWEIVLKTGCQKSVNFDHKNEVFSPSLNSFHSRPIFWPSLGHKLSRNAFVVSIAFPERISRWRKYFS